MTVQIALAAPRVKPATSWWRRNNYEGLLFILALALAWEILARTALSGFENIASTSQTLVSLVGLVADGTLLDQVGHTLGVTLVGWVLAVVIGGVLGMWLGLSQTAWRYSMASVEVLRSIPSISFIPVAILIFGFSPTMEIVVVVYVCMWPVLMGALNGVREVSPGLRDTAQTLSLGRWRTITRVILPAAVPRLLVGIRLALALAIALAVIAEMLGNPEGLGFGIVFVQRAFRPGDVFAYLLAIGLIGWLLNTIFTVLMRKFAPKFAGTL